MIPATKESKQKESGLVWEERGDREKKGVGVTEVKDHGGRDLKSQTPAFPS